MKEDRLVRISTFELEGVPMVDIRYWKETSAGPRATKEGIEVPQVDMARLIWGLQKARAEFNSDEAKKSLGIH